MYRPGDTFVGKYHHEHMKPKSFNIEHLRCNAFRRAGKTFDMVRYEDFMAETVGTFQRPHRHNYYMLLLATEGAGKQLIDFNSHDVRKARVFLMFPGQIHAWQEDHDLKGYLIFFTAEFFTLRYNNNNLLEFPFFQPGAPSPFVDLCDERLDHLECICDTMLQEYERGATDYLKLLRSYLNIFLINCKRLYDHAYTQVDTKDQNAALTVQNFIQLIEQHFAEKHKVRDYAEMLLITPNYLNALCTRITGKSAGELIRERIMLEAKRMLLHDTRTVAEIGHDLHFEDNSYFCRFFKKYEGTSPEKFRKYYQGIQ